MVDLEKMRFLINRQPRLWWDIEKEEAKATKITTTLTGMPRGSGNHSQVEDGAIRLATLKEVYGETLAELERMRNELDPLISMLDDPDDRAVMRLRYIKGYNINTIAESIHRSERCIYYYLSRAEDKISRLQQNA